MNRLVRQCGQSLVEVLVVIGLLTIMLPAIATAVVSARDGKAQSTERLQAVTILQEATEAMRSIREQGWTQIATNGTYHPVRSGNGWTLASGSEAIDGFNRQVTIEDATRNSGGTLVASGGNVDASTKKITVQVTWNSPIPSTLSQQIFLQRYRGNAAWLQTTQADFSAGTALDTVIANAAGGEVQLKALQGGDDWGVPLLVGSYNAEGSQDNTDVAIAGNYAYLADNTVLRILNITNPASPTLVGSYTAAGVINRLVVAGNYAYLATAADAAELVIVNVANPAAPAVASSLDLSGAANAQSVAVDGTYAYVGRVLTSGTTVREFYIVNVTNPAAPVTAGSLDVTGTVYGIRINGNVAYLSTAVNDQELKTANITNKAAPAFLGSYDVPGGADTRDIDAVGSTVYLPRAWDAANPELQIVNAANPAAPVLLGSYELGSTSAINGISVAGNYAYLATDSWGKQFIVLDVSNPATPFVKGTLDLFATAFGIRHSNGKAYIATAGDSQELMVVGPSAAPSGYVANGTFESTTFDTGISGGAAMNRLQYSANVPAGTQVRFQIATNNNNTTWNYVGPDGTNSSYYDSSQAIRFGTLGRYVRVRATLQGNGVVTPTLQDVTVNYSP